MEVEIRRVFDVNTVSHFLLAKEFLPAMIKSNHGHIVTVASMACFLVHARNVDYTSTKACALGFHEGLAQELKVNIMPTKSVQRKHHFSTLHTSVDVPILTCYIKHRPSHIGPNASNSAIDR